MNKGQCIVLTGTCLSCLCVCLSCLCVCLVVLGTVMNRENMVGKGSLGD